MRVLLSKRYNPAKPLLFGKSGYYLAKDIFCGKIIIMYQFYNVKVLAIAIDGQFGIC